MTKLSGMSMRLAGVLLAAALLLAAFGTASASAASPWWHFTVRSVPTNLPPGGEGTIQLVATNIGDASMDEEAMTLSATVPTGITIQGADFVIPGLSPFQEILGQILCAHTATVIQCTLRPHELSEELGGMAVGVQPFQRLEVQIPVAAGNAQSEGRMTAMVSGGGALAVSIAQPVSVNSTPAPFGVQEYSMTPEAEGGSPDAQAGSHPFQLTAALALNVVDRFKPEKGQVFFESQHPRDLQFKLPAGLVGNVSATGQCTMAQFLALEKPAGSSATINRCPASSAIGVAVAAVEEPHFIGLTTVEVPVFNLNQARGEPARFGFLAAETPVVLDTSVRAGDDYGVTVSVSNVSQATSVLSSLVTIWGVPGDPRHAQSRGTACLLPQFFPPGSCRPELEVHPKPLLTLPSSCTSVLQAPMTLNSWVDPSFLPQERSAFEEQLEGCDSEPFNPEIELQPSNLTAASPTGLTVHLKVPQQASETPEGVAEADVRNTTVVLPAGLQINPAAAAGLQACTEADIGFERYDSETGQSFFHEETEQERLGEAPHQECPEGSKLGTVKITTPLLSEPLEGAVYQAAQEANPFGSLLALYVVAEDKKAGVRVRLAGKVEANPATGQLVSTFDQTPQLPFEEFDLKFFGGNRAPLATSGCGAYKTETSIEPWSGNAAATPFSEFDVSSGPDGTACPDPWPFAPTFTAGTTNNQADAFSPFTLTLARKDGEQTLGSLNMTLPPGLAGILASVAQCGEAQANAGTCPAASQIGHVTVQAGVGNEPITLPEAGRSEDPVYLTGPYEGAPFGLAVVVHPEAGPFNLEEGGRPVVVRAKIEVNPHTAQASVLSGAMPTILRGIPLDVRTIDVTIDRAGFMFNPTNCAATSIAGAVASSEGASESVSSHFQAVNCATLPFKPKFTISTQGKTSKADGASLDVKLTSKGGPQAGGGEANIRAVKVDLPKQLPSRLTTLQKACTEAQFDANPAGCPAASNVGSATAHTPIFSHPLSGPAYFVSHGGQAFPELEIVLQGEGVTLILEGNTDIKKGITSSIFRSVPDAPITDFELKLPTGPYSILGTNLPASAKYSLCGQKLAMPTAFVGQNGAEIHTSTPISVEGCKPAIRVLRQRVKGATATLLVSVPVAGRLVATGGGLSKATKKAKKAGTVTVKLHLTKGEAAFLARHHGRRLKARINLRFTPKKGARLTTTTTVLIG